VLNHVSFGCSDLAAATAFYDAVLGALGFARVCQGGSYSGYARPGETDDRFSVKLVQRTHPSDDGFHLAFSAPSRDAVRRFHEAALAHGGKDDGAPGLRSQYGANYFAAFVIDRDGYSIEAVCHDPE
jgi:catechol 2,3-dioxygenase-like lactoylglutathione lyase family enzyme